MKLYFYNKIFNSEKGEMRNLMGSNSPLLLKLEYLLGSDSPTFIKITMFKVIFRMQIAHPY